MLSKAALTVIDVLTTGREATVAALTRATELSKPHLYEVIDELIADDSWSNTVAPTTNGTFTSPIAQSLKHTEHFTQNLAM